MKQRIPAKPLVFIITLVCFLLIGTSGAWARTFSHIIAFGDSLTDHGGLISYVGPANAREVWSNGNVWVEYMAKDWDADLDNNAIAGAKTMGHEDTGIQAMSDAGKLPQLGLVGQVNTYIDGSPKFNAYETLFTIWIGGNDLLEFGKNEGPNAGNAEGMINDAMTHINTAMTALENEGARYILVMNLPDVGKTPLYYGKTTSESVSKLSTQFNTALDTLVENFKAKYPDVRVYTFDVFTYLHEMIESNVFPDTIGSYMKLDENGKKIGGTNEPATDHLFWDSIHPTTKAHQILGDKVATTVAEADDTDSTCFISTSAAPTTEMPVPLFPSILLISGLCLFMIHHRNSKAGSKTD